MIAPEPTPPQADLPAAARLRLRTIVERLVAGTIDDAGLQRELRELASEARAQRITPERCLIALRQAWATLAHPRFGDEAARRETLQWRLVSQLIGAYYHDAGPTDR